MSVDIPDTIAVIIPDSQPTLTRSSSRGNRYKNGITMVVLFFINLLNYMDRFSIAGVLKSIENDFHISDTKSGLLQTVFVCSYMALAPLFGYLGDRYSRKALIIAGVTFWSVTTLAGSFVPNDLFVVFLILRGLVGIGEASYSCVAPTIIADMYKHDMRTLMLAIFNIAIPLGGGLGYIVGSSVAKALGHWRWALRVTPPLGIVCVVLLAVIVKEPARGSADGAATTKQESWVSDVSKILRVKSFVFTTLGFTWVAFAIGSLAWHGPKFLQIAQRGKETEANVSLYFGIITCVSGLLGVLLGSEIARRYRKRNPRGDPIVCGIAVLLGIPFVVALLLLSKSNTIATWICIFICQTLFSSNWALISDILMYIIVPSRRSTASSLQIFVMHLLGDASSPYVVGIISDFFRKESNDPDVHWESLRNGLLLTPAVACLGGIAFLFAAAFIVKDRRAAEVAIEAMNSENAFRMDESSKVH